MLPADLLLGRCDGGFELPHLVGDLAISDFALREPFRQVRLGLREGREAFRGRGLFFLEGRHRHADLGDLGPRLFQVLPLRGKLPLEALDARLGAAVAGLEVLEHGGGPLDLARGTPRAGRRVQRAPRRAC